MSEILPNSTPIRISLTPWWNQMHADYHSYEARFGKVKPADCQGCHKERGP